jgi:tetratricopeptide (TPR) repeat protein
MICEPWMPALCHDCLRANKQDRTCNKLETALWVCALLSVANGSWAQANAAPGEPSPSSAATSAAQLAIERAEELFDAENYAGALSEFATAHTLLEGNSKRAAMLNNIALCHERMFHYDLALAYYERYLHEAGPQARGRAAAESALRRLRRLLVTLEVESNVAAELWIDSRRIGRVPGRVLVPAGEHVLELRAPLYESTRRELSLPAGRSARLRFELERLSQYRGISPAYVWIGAGVTIAALGTGVGFGISALAADHAGEERRRRDPLLNTVEAEASVKRRALAADIAFAAAGVLGATTLALFFVTDFGGERASLTFGPGGVSLRRSF